MNSEASPQTIVQTWHISLQAVALGQADEASRCWLLDA